MQSLNKTHNLLSAQFAFYKSYEGLINHILAFYVIGSFTVCKIFSAKSTLLRDLQMNTTLPSISIDLSDNLDHDPLLTGIELGCNLFMVEQELVEVFLDRFVEVHDEATYRYTNKTVFLLQDSYFPKNMNQVANHDALDEIKHLLVFEPNLANHTISLFNRLPVSNGLGYSFNLLSRFDFKSRTFHEKKLKLPGKLTNLFGQSIRLATFNVIPHIIFKETISKTHPVVRSLNKIYTLDGLDGLLMVEFCIQLNCSIELILDEVNMWGTIQDNKTGNGVLGSVIDRRADVGACAMSSWFHCLKHLRFSKPFLRGGVTCLTPKPESILPWKTMIMVFTETTWILIVITFGLIVTLYLLTAQVSNDQSKHRCLVWNILNVMSMFLLQSTHVRRRSPSEVILSTALLLFALNLCNIYSSKNSSFRTIPLYEHPIDTIDQLAESGVTWVQAHEAWIFSLKLSKNPNIQKLVSNFKVYQPSELLQISDEGGIGLAMGRLQNGHLMLGDWITPANVHHYRLMRQDLYYEYEIAMATKTWPLMDQFDELIMRTYEASLRYFQELQVIYKHSNYVVQTTLLNSHLRESTAPHALEVMHLLGGFFIHGVGTMFSVVVFLVEKITVKTRKIVQ